MFVGFGHRASERSWSPCSVISCPVALLLQPMRHGLTFVPKQVVPSITIGVERMILYLHTLGSRPVCGHQCFAGHTSNLVSSPFVLGRAFALRLVRDRCSRLSQWSRRFASRALGAQTLFATPRCDRLSYSECCPLSVRTLVIRVVVPYLYTHLSVALLARLQRKNSTGTKHQTLYCQLCFPPNRWPC